MADDLIVTDDVGIQWVQRRNADGSTTSYRLTPRPGRSFLTRKPIQPVTRKETWQGAPEGFGPKALSAPSTPLVRKTSKPAIPRVARFTPPLGNK